MVQLRRTKRRLAAEQQQQQKSSPTTKKRSNANSRSPSLQKRQRIVAKNVQSQQTAAAEEEEEESRLGGPSIVIRISSQDNDDHGSLANGNGANNIDENDDISDDDDRGDDQEAQTGYDNDDNYENDDHENFDHDGEDEENEEEEEEVIDDSFHLPNGLVALLNMYCKPSHLAHQKIVSFCQCLILKLLNESFGVSWTKVFDGLLAEAEYMRRLDVCLWSRQSEMLRNKGLRTGRRKYSSLSTTAAAATSSTNAVAIDNDSAAEEREESGDDDDIDSELLRRFNLKLLPKILEHNVGQQQEDGRTSGQTTTQLSTNWEECDIWREYWYLMADKIPVYTMGRFKPDSYSPDLVFRPCEKNHLLFFELRSLDTVNYGWNNVQRVLDECYYVTMNAKTSCTLILFGGDFMNNELHQTIETDGGLSVVYSGRMYFDQQKKELVNFTKSGGHKYVTIEVWDNIELLMLGKNRVVQFFGDYFPSLQALILEKMESDKKLKESKESSDDLSDMDFEQDMEQELEMQAKLNQMRQLQYAPPPQVVTKYKESDINATFSLEDEEEEEEKTPKKRKVTRRKRAVKRTPEARVNQQDRLPQQQLRKQQAQSQSMYQVESVQYLAAEPLVEMKPCKPAKTFIVSVPDRKRPMYVRLMNEQTLSSLKEAVASKFSITRDFVLCDGNNCELDDETIPFLPDESKLTVDYDDNDVSLMPQIQNNSLQQPMNYVSNFHANPPSQLELLIAQNQINENAGTSTSLGLPSDLLALLNEMSIPPSNNNLS